MSTTQSSPAQMAREIILIDEERKRISARDSELKERRGTLEAELVDHLVDEGMTGMTVDGRNVHLQHRMFFRPAEGVDKAKVAEALEGLGMTDLIKIKDYNSTSLDSRLKEIVQTAQDRRALLADQGEDVEFTADPVEDLPEQLRGLLVCSVKTDIRAPKR